MDTETHLRDRISEGVKQGDLNLRITDKAADLTEDLVSALADYRRAIMAGFTKEEERRYLDLSERAGKNARAALEH